MDLRYQLLGTTVGPAAWSTVSAWATNTAYVAGPPASTVTFGGGTYVCLVSHTSGTFSTDLSNGKWVQVAAPGATGATGAQGSTGAAGAQGSTGAAGSAGARGSLWYEASGAPGTISGALANDLYLDTVTGNVWQYSGSAWSQSGNIKGATGAAGATGAQGPQGTAGAQGAQGNTGATGPAGPVLTLVRETAAFTAAISTSYKLKGSALTITLPASPGDTGTPLWITGLNGDESSNPHTVNAAGSDTITAGSSSAASASISSTGITFIFVPRSSPSGWDVSIGG